MFFDPIAAQARQPPLPLLSLPVCVGVCAHHSTCRTAEPRRPVKIRNKERPVSGHYGTRLLLSKYGTIPYFTGRLATLGAVSSEYGE